MNKNSPASKAAAAIRVGQRFMFMTILLFSDTNGIAYGACEITAPAAGIWHVAVDRLQGAGDFQLLTTEFGVERVTPCTGDCDGDGTVSIAEIVRSVTIAQGNPLTQCPAIDANGDGTARIDELVAAVAAALSGCA